MKLLVIIVNNDDAKAATKALVKNKFYSTKLSSTGGFLSTGNTTLLVGCDDKDVDKVIEVVRGEAHQRTKQVMPMTASSLGLLGGKPLEVTVGGATIFVLDVEKFIKL